MSEVPGYVIRFFLSTVPFLCVLSFLLYKAWERPRLAADYDQNNNNADYDDGEVFSLMDILAIFLSFHVMWSMFVIYLIIFIPKRRHFLGRYLSDDAETALGDVIFDPDSRACGVHLQDYGYALYAHPTQPNTIVRKHVRVYQAYTRERVTIARLPNRPFSGQVKIDVEIDLRQMRTQRDETLRWITWIGLFWFVFTLAGASYALYQLHVTHRLALNENTQAAKRLFIIVVGLNVPICYGANWIRFLFYHNWMVNRAALIEDENEARTVHPFCSKVESEDGSDRIPYSILGDTSTFKGSLPSYQVPPRTGTGATFQPPLLQENPIGRVETSSKSKLQGRTLAM
mmetsp:Transcript_41649/g.99835  ORF Transcript_41649/g.99835 Transcript_41649/m.99835 type:complete len:343 (-) Transcript_41649:3706-4734(-)